MGLFEDIAVLDLKFRIVLVASVLTFIGVSILVLLLFKSEIAFVVGGVAAVGVAYVTIKRLS